MINMCTSGEGTNAWNIKKDIQLTYWKNVCNEYSNIHDKYLTKYEKINKIFTICKMSLSAGISILSGINTYYGLQQISILILTLSGLSISILTFGKYLAPETKIIQHNICSKRYKQLYLKIDKELAQEYSERINGSEFIKLISSELQDFMSINYNIISELKNVIRQKSIKNLQLENIASNTSLSNSSLSNSSSLHNKTPEIKSQFELFFNSLPGIDIELSIQKDRFNNL